MQLNLFHQGNLDEDEATLLLSEVVMNLLLAEDLDIADGLEVSLVGQLGEIQWQALLPQVKARIVLENEDTEAIASLQEDILRTCQLNDISSELDSITRLKQSTSYIG